MWKLLQCPFHVFKISWIQCLTKQAKNSFVTACHLVICVCFPLFLLLLHFLTACKVNWLPIFCHKFMLLHFGISIMAGHFFFHSFIIHTSCTMLLLLEFKSDSCISNLSTPVQTKCDRLFEDENGNRLAISPSFYFWIIYCIIFYLKLSWMLRYKSCMSTKWIWLEFAFIELNDVYSYICPSSAAYTCLRLHISGKSLNCILDLIVTFSFNVSHPKPTLIVRITIFHNSCLKKKVIL